MVGQNSTVGGVEGVDACNSLQNGMGSARTKDKAAHCKSGEWPNNRHIGIARERGGGGGGGGGRKPLQKYLENEVN